MRQPSPCREHQLPKYDKAIIPSLTTATEWLPNKGRSGNSTPSKWAAKACLADAYMTMAGWPLNKGTEYYGLAAAQAKEIMDNKAQAGLPCNIVPNIR